MAISDDKKAAILDINGLAFSWPGARSAILEIDRLTIHRGEKVFLQGASGSGKTTLLSLIAAVLQAQSGKISVNGIAIDKLPGRRRDRFRSDNIGLIFQQFNLLSFLPVIDNVSLPCRFSKSRRRSAIEQSGTIDAECRRLLQAMRLDPESIVKQSVNELSVGQQQRVAVARALIGRPPLVIADEPTSALDSDTRDAFVDLLFTEAEAAGSSLLFVSHDQSLASHFDRHIKLSSINKAHITDSPGESLC